MDDLLAARSTMALSLAFHIIFACIGMTMPLLMVVSHWLHIKTGENVYLKLTKAWSKGVAIFFAIGAVSGTALSFELGILWPGFMEHAGAIIGMPFSWEGTAFFVEAICLGLFLYGWNRINKWIHWFSGLLVGLSGIASGIFVVCANAWMNAPAGFDWINGQAHNIDPFAAMFNDAWVSQTLHMTIAAIEATAFAVAGVHAFLLLKKKENVLHKKAMIIALWFGAVAAIAQPLSGDFSAKDVAKRQPIKLAAMEGQFETLKGAPLTIGGIPDEKTRTTSFGIKIPHALSFLSYGDFNAEVKGLNEFPEEHWPPVLITHLAFQVMVGCGTVLALVGVIFLFFQWKKKHLLLNKNFLKIIFLCTPLGFIAVEAGWIVTEVGRQPWIIYGIMKTSEAVTPVPGQAFHLALFSIIYSALSVIAFWLLKRQIKVLDNDPELNGGANA
ncbi:MAG: cytochrome ubiquinol oxidase subunit I [Ignavibacteriales bacterium]|nr:MAG: cytochrome ubiquinol oxidase subunit I [Ignavibacteriales bacterium]